MPRRRPPARRAGPRPLPTDSRRVEQGPDGDDYEVTAVPATRAAKTYRCPGCDHEIKPGIAHVVAWPVNTGDAEDRRHWHTSCWTNGRSPTRRWS